MRKSIIIVGCLLFAALVTGCARTVTNVNFGSSLVVKVTLRGNADTTNNRYFMVFGTTPNLKVPLPPPYNNIGGINYEFLEPDGTRPVDGTSLEAYYTNYFSTWSGYVVLDGSGFFAVPGPFQQSAPIIRTSPFAYFTPGTNQISFNFPLNQVFVNTGLPNTAYFDFVTVSWLNGSYKYSRDHLEGTNAYISTQTGSSITVSDPADPAINGSLDILTCEVTVQ